MVDIDDVDDDDNDGDELNEQLKGVETNAGNAVFKAAFDLAGSQLCLLSFLIFFSFVRSLFVRIHFQIMEIFFSFRTLENDSLYKKKLFSFRFSESFRFFLELKNICTRVYL